MRLVPIAAAVALALALPQADAAWSRRSAADSYCPLPAAGTTVTCTYAAAVSVHDVLRVCVATFAGTAINSVSDSVNGSTGWAAEELEFNETDNTAGKARCFYNKDTLAGTPVVSVVLGVSDQPVIRMFAYSGLDNTAPLVTAVRHNGVGSSTTPQCDSVTPMEAGDLLASTLIIYQDTTIAPNNGETEIYDDNAFQGEDKSAPSTSAYQAGWSLGAARQIGCASAIYALPSSTNVVNPINGPTQLFRPVR